MCLEWITLACARHISPSLTESWSSSPTAGTRRLMERHKRVYFEDGSVCQGPRAMVWLLTAMCDCCLLLSGVKVKPEVSQPYSGLAYSAITAWHPSRHFGHIKKLIEIKPWSVYHNGPVTSEASLLYSFRFQRCGVKPSQVLRAALLRGSHGHLFM